jgi:hypothetical protein
MKRIIFISIFLFCFGCVSYSLVSKGRVDIGDNYSVETETDWSGRSTGGITIWTFNGTALDRIVFLSDIEDKKTLFGEDSHHKFEKEMNPIEIAELFLDSLQTFGKWPQVKKANLRMSKLGSFDGLSFELNLVSEEGLKYKGLVSCAIIDEKLNIIYFLAPKLHYYPKYIQDYKNIINSIKPT